MDKALLRSVMALHGEKDRDLAYLLGISPQSFNSKINERNTEFKQGEIAAIRDHYQLTAEQVSAIFFS